MSEKETNAVRKGILDGVRVVEFAQVMAIPFAGLLLADMGAEVIKVEPPEGDAFRWNQQPIVPGESKGFVVFNRGKRSLCLDLRNPDSRPVVEKLVAQADVVLISFKPPDVRRYGLTYEWMSSINPKIVYLEHMPLGPKGPYGEDGGYDVLVQGMSGLATLTARLSGEAPANVRPAYTDMATGFVSALGVVSALLHRERTGEGQRLETSLLGTGLALGGNILHWFAATDPEVWSALVEELTEMRREGAEFEQQRQAYERRVLGGSYGNIYFRHYRTADGFISVGCLSPVLNARLREATGLHDPRMDPGFELGTPEAYDALTKLIREAEDLFKTRTTQDWIDYLRSKGVPCGPFNFPHEVFEDPQVLANEFVVELEHPVLGPYRTFASPVRFDRTPTEIRDSSPPLDRDTDSVLAELGLSEEEITRLRESGVTGMRMPEGV